MITINQIFNLSPQDQTKYNVHLSCRSGEDNPLDVFWRDEAKYAEWQSWKGNQKDGKIVKEKFKRNYIISFAVVYNESKDIHLFTGVYEIIERGDLEYKIRKTEMFASLIGRLKIQHKRRGQATSFRLENIIDTLIVHEITAEKLKFRNFDGYNKINLKFSELEVIVKKDIKDWKLKLNHMQGVYMLIDDKTGKLYIGSASGEYGIWQRWSDYIYNFTGGNKVLDSLHKEHSSEYFITNFRFVLLEYFTDKTDSKDVLERESYWKNAFDSRKDYNRN